LIHQPLGGIGGKASDIAIRAQEIVRARQRIAELIARETNKPLEVVLKDIERDYWLSAQEAIDYGLVGRIVKGREEL
jgi:ATP-dependent Clp protease protease subunit